MDYNNTDTISSCKQVVNHLLAELKIKTDTIKQLEYKIYNHENKLEAYLKNLNESWANDFEELTNKHNDLGDEYDKLFSYCITLEGELEQFNKMDELD